MMKKKELLALGVEKLANALISLHENDIIGIQKKVELAVAAQLEDPKQLISLIRKDLTTFKRSDRFISYKESGKFANDLDQVQSWILSLSQTSSVDAMKLMERFLDLQEVVLNRVDDSNGSISDVFIAACKNFGAICAQVPLFVEEAVDLVYARFMQDNYGIYRDIIVNFKTVLTKEGLVLLQDKMKQAANPENAYTVQCALKSIADCQKDVDAYLQACFFHGTLSSYDHIEIAERLIADNRATEALEWLDEQVSESSELKIKALTMNAEVEEAQQERVKWFKASLSPDVYGEVLQNTDSKDRDNFKIEAIQEAFLSPRIDAAIRFLIDIQEFQEAAKLVRLKIEQVDGFYSLRPIANELSATDPLAATLLYRKMIEPVLKKAVSKYYKYAIKDLISCIILSSTITHWESFPTHQEYFTSLQEIHKRKSSFWTQYQAIQKQGRRNRRKKRFLS